MRTENFRLTPEEEAAIRFYMGDPAPEIQGSCRGGTDAYNTINALLYPGCDNEMDKAAEGRVIELFDAAHLKDYLRLIRLITGAMARFREACLTDPDHLHPAYRIEREASLERYRNAGRIYGFFSACREGFLQRYARKKDRIILLEVLRDDSLPYLDFTKLFGDFYAKPEEAEILMPYGSRIASLEEMPLTEEEKELYSDRSGRPPLGRYRMVLTADSFWAAGDPPEAMTAEALSEETVSRIAEMMRRLTHREKLTDKEISEYSKWKNQVMKIVGCKC